MDNVVASRAAVDNITVTGEGALQIQYAKALLAKAVEQQNTGADSQGCMYSCLSGSSAASSGRPMVANTLNCPPPEPLQLQHRPAHAALPTNTPRPANNFVAANGQPVDARTHIVNNQSWSARQRDDLRHTLTNRRDGKPRGSLSGIRPQCFGPMI